MHTPRHLSLQAVILAAISIASGCGNESKLHDPESSARPATQSSIAETSKPSRSPERDHRLRAIQLGLTQKEVLDLVGPADDASYVTPKERNSLPFYLWRYELCSEGNWVLVSFGADGRVNKVVDSESDVQARHGSASSMRDDLLRALRIGTTKAEVMKTIGKPDLWDWVRTNNPDSNPTLHWTYYLAEPRVNGADKVIVYFDAHDEVSQILDSQ